MQTKALLSEQNVSQMLSAVKRPGPPSQLARGDLRRR